MTGLLRFHDPIFYGLINRVTGAPAPQKKAPRPAAAPTTAME